jgi:hypothetical protein
MFQYWSAPPSLLRTWAYPQDPDPALDDKLHLGSLAVWAGEEFGSFFGQIGCYVRALFSSRAADSRLSAC